MSNARTAILERLRAAPKKPLLDLPAWTPYTSTTEAPLDRFIRMMSAVKGEIRETTRADWTNELRRVLAEKGCQNLLYGPKSEIGKQIDKAWKAEPGAKLVPYDKPIEDLKALMVNDIDAGITSTIGAIADTGSLIVWPSPEEPRLMSLVPPIHIAVLDGSKMYDNLPEAMQKLGWPKSAPGNNQVLISGPSKTADIEGILCFGAHGPKQLVILLIKD